ncbi:hypothetical protein ACFQH6_15140 [Halobacteriaceae archaeon GCM10025711]
MSNDNRWVSAELREALSRGDLPALAEAGLLEQTDLEYLLSFKRSVANAEDTDRYQELLMQAVSKKLNKAVEHGNLSVMSHANGISKKRIDATGYTRLVKAIKPAAHQVLFKGPKGSGKSTKAIDLTKELHAEFNGDLKVMTNIKGPDEHEDVRFGEAMSEFLEFANESGEKVIVADEMSTVANHWISGPDVQQQFGRAINALRKGSGGSTRLFIIGHEHDTDIHPILREQSDVVIQADGKKDEGLIDKVTVFKGWQAYKKSEDWFRVRGLRDVPQSSPWSFDTNYFAHFEFDLDEPAKQIQRGRLVDNWEDYQGGEGGEEDGVEVRVKCRGVKKDGTGCGSMTPHESGFCEWHRDQWDGAGSDPRFNE